MRAVAVALSLCALAAACGSDPPPEEATTPLATVRPGVSVPAGSDYQSWVDVAADLEPGLDPRSDNPCQSGHPRCLDLLLAEMELREGILSDACDHDAVFAIVYLSETEAVQGLVEDGALEDPATFVNLTAWFAHRYVVAYDDWHFERGSVPRSWSVVFEPARDRELRSIGNALASVNAHVTFDLPVVLADIYGADISSEPNADYLAINQSIVEQTPVVLDRIATRLDPDIAVADIPGLAGGFGEIIERWRADSWASGVELASESGADREQAREELDDRTATQAQVVMAASQYVGSGGLAERDQFCLDNIPT